MSKKMILMFVVMFSMVMIVNAQEVTERLEKAGNDPQVATETQKAAEIKEINTQEKAKEKEANAQLNGDTANQIKDEVSKEVAEDEAEAAEEAEEDNDSSSWFGWLWPFGGDDDDDAIAVEEETNEPVAEVVETEEVTADTPAVESEVVEEPVTEVAEEIIAEETPEPAVAEDAEEDDGGSWFGWLWPFGDDDDSDDVAVSEDEQEPVAEVKESEETPTEVVEEVVETPAEETVVEETGEEPVVEVAAEEDSEGGINVANKLIYYFPNLFLNLIDSFSGKIGVGAKSGVELMLTRHLQFGGNYGDEYFVEKGVYRRYGGGYNNGYSFDLGPLSSEKRYIDDVFGSIPSRIIKQSKAKVQRPSDSIYKDKYRDYWAIGVEAGWLVNIGLYFNPIEFADFFTGIFFYDLCDDDLGRSEEQSVENTETSEVVEETPETNTEIIETSETEEPVEEPVEELDVLE